MKNFKQIDIKPKFLENFKPKIGVITLSTDFTVEQDFRNICKNLNVNIYVNRIPFENPLNQENYLKMINFLPDVAKNILPGIKIDSIAYACTSGTVAIGDKIIKDKIHKAKSDVYVSTPINAAIKSFSKMKINKIAVLTPYPKKVNETIFEFLEKSGIEITSFYSFNLDYDSEIANVDPYFLLETITKLKDQKAEAVFVSCTALRVVEILNQVEKIISKPVISSNQALIWDTLRSVNIKDSIKNYGQLFLN